LVVARSHDPDLRLVRGDVIDCPFRDASFDAVYSSYVAEHFEDGPENLFREIHRLLRPRGLLLVVVPYNSPFRRLLAHRALQLYYGWAHWQGRPLAFTEFRYSRSEMRAFLSNTGFAVEHEEADDFKMPWAKGLSLDLGPLVLDQPGTWQMNGFGRVLGRVLKAISPWTCAAGILFVARKA
jgi:SAM-dependent methyltransferase